MNETTAKNRLKTYQEFWPFYLSEHQNKLNRKLHFVGTTLGFFLLFLSVILKNPWFVLYALVSGYAFAWIGHFVIEKNRPATFQYPVWSFISDWKMWLLTILQRPLK